jgi:hypothetical protein
MDLSANCFRSQGTYLSGSDKKVMVIAKTLINSYTKILPKNGMFNNIY